LIRHSFRGALAQLPSSAGLQVHRSHWAAFGHVREVQVGKPLQLRLADGTAIPVSSSYHKAVLLTKNALTGR
jgi:DNA-binding LytR/AlgR family response regulator